MRFLLDLVDDEHQPEPLREAALRALGDTQKPRAVRLLIERLAGDDELVRKNAVAGLSRADHPAARAALEETAATDEGAVGRAAAAALEAIEQDREGGGA